MLLHMDARTLPRLLGRLAGSRPRAAPYRRRVSARARFVAWLVLAVMICGAGAVVGMRQVLLVKQDDRLRAELGHELNELQAAYLRTTSSAGSLDVRLRQAIAQLVDEDESVGAVVNGRLVASRPGVGVDVANEPELLRHLTTGVKGQDPLHVQSNELRGGAQLTSSVPPSPPVTFVVAGTLATSRHEVRAPVVAAMQAGVVTLLVLVMLSWLLVGRLLQPVRTITRTAQLIGGRNLRQRIPVSGDDEFAELATTINQMLARVEDAFRSQRAFLDDAGHELRTPLTVLQALLEELRAEVSTDPERSFVPLLQGEVRRMRRAVDDMLLLARADRPDFLRLVPVDIRELLEDTRRLSAGWTGCTWQLIPPPNIIVVADRDRLTQALMQLAENAVRHTPPGTTITYSAEQDGDSVLLHVSDTGPGVPAELRTRIFERFFRGDPSRPDSSGLGLSIVAAIAAAHGGAAQVTTTPGGGATFTLRIPVDHPSGVGCEEDNA